MSVVKELIVLNVGPMGPSKKTDYSYRRIGFKSVDETDKTNYSLNLTYYPNNPKQSSRWESMCKPGNVIKLTMQDKNPKNVDQFKTPELIKNVAASKEEITKDNVNKSLVQIEIDKIRTSLTVIEDNL